MEDLHRRGGSKRFWEEEQEHIDFGKCCLILSCSLWEVRPTVYSDCHSGMRIDKSRCFSVKLAVHLASDEAIGLHLLQNPTCAQHFDDSRFSILAQGRSPFHLSALEATFIKTSTPALCRQKEFVYSLKIVH